MIARYLVRRGVSAASARCCSTANSCGRGSIGRSVKRKPLVPPTAIIAPIMNGCYIVPNAAPLDQVRYHGGPSISADAPTIKLTFVNPPSKTEGDDAKAERLTVDARVGETLLQVAHRNHIEVEGACEGVCACSTCHVILSEDLYDKLADEWDQEASEDEEDMLDMAFGLTGTSRLGCQVTVRKDMEGEEIQLPSATRNFYVDGHVPQPH